MEQHKTKKSKRMWSIIVSVHAPGIVSRGVGGSRRVTKEEYMTEYLHLNVTKFWKNGNIFFVVEGKKVHKYDLGRVYQVQMREYKRSGVQ